MHALDMTVVTKLLIDGSWTDIEEGSLELLPGHTLFGNPTPLVKFRLADGQTAAAQLSSVAGWAPYASTDQPTVRYEDPAGAITEAAIPRMSFASKTDNWETSGRPPAVRHLIESAS